jgi:hypothetical protein
MKNQCKTRLSSHSSLSSHMSARPFISRQALPLRRREGNCRQSVTPAELQPKADVGGEFIASSVREQLGSFSGSRYSLLIETPHRALRASEA